MFFGEEGYGRRISGGNGCWSWWRIAGKQHHGMELASSRQPCEFLPPMGGRLKATQDGGRSQPEERHGKNSPPGKTRCGIFLEISPVPNTFCGAATLSMCLTHPIP
jgi:hypothetical protein